MTRTSTNTLGGLLRAAAASTPDREALVFPTDRLTYADLAARVDAMAKGLVGLGVQPGENVGVLMHNCVEHVVLWFATGSIGATCVPINTRNQPRELAHVLSDAQLRVVFTSSLGAEYSDLPSRLREAMRLLDDELQPAGNAAPQHVFVLGGRTSSESGPAALEKLASGVSEAALEARRSAVVADQPAIMLYTSGTTAMPKGCPLKHRQLVDISRQIGERWGTRDGDRVWDGLPMFHASSILPLLVTMIMRGTYFSQHHFDASEALAIIAREKATMAWPAFNTIWQEILTQPTFTPDALASLRAVLCVGPGETIRKMESVAPDVPLLSCYGITEGIGVPVMVRHTDDERTRTESSGRPFDGIEVSVRDSETHAPLEPGERGTLWLRGRNVFAGYWRDPEKTAEVFDDEDWFSTGDLASVDADGLVYYHGRMKDMLKVGGENVAAVEIEAYLSTHPAVKLAAVVGVPDSRYGEVPAAFVELRPGAEATSDDIISFCQGQIAGFKVPRHVRFVTTWPMSATKIRKVDLRESLSRELGLA